MAEEHIETGEPFVWRERTMARFEDEPKLCEGPLLSAAGTFYESRHYVLTTRRLIACKVTSLN